MKPKQTASQLISLHWRHDYKGTHVRVWRENWFGDEFEVMDTAEFTHLQEFCKRFSIPLQEHGDDD